MAELEDKKTPVEPVVKPDGLVAPTKDPEPSPVGSTSTDQDKDEVIRLRDHNKELLADVKKERAKNKKIQDAIDVEAAKALEEEGEFKTLYDQSQKKLTEKDQKIKEKELKSLAAKRLHDPNDILPFMDRFEFDESFNVIEGGKVLDTLEKEKSYLFTGKLEPTVPVDKTKPSTSFSKEHIFTAAEVGKMSVEQYKENEKEILRQTNAGLIK